MLLCVFFYKQTYPVHACLLKGPVIYLIYLCFYICYAFKFKITYILKHVYLYGIFQVQVTVYLPVLVSLYAYMVNQTQF